MLKIYRRSMYLLRVQKLNRLLPLYDAKCLRTVSFKMCKNCEHNRTSSTYTLLNSLQRKDAASYKNVVISPMLCSTSAVSPNTLELVDSNVFEKVCEETLESLTEFFEELVESKEAFESADISYSGGVLTANLGKNYGTYVINRQSPNRQIWLSSPVSGPKRYDYVVNDNYWIYKHDMVSLHKLLQLEISNMLGEKVDLSKCLYSKV